MDMSDKQQKTKSYTPKLDKSWKHLTYDGCWHIWKRKPKFDGLVWDGHGVALYVNNILQLPKPSADESECIWEIDHGEEP